MTQDQDVPRSPSLAEQGRSAALGAMLRSEFKGWFRSRWILALLVLWPVGLGSGALVGSGLAGDILERGWDGVRAIGGLRYFAVLVTLETACIILVAPLLVLASVARNNAWSGVEASRGARRDMLVAVRLLALFCYATLLIITALPLAVVCFVYGGVAPVKLLLSTAIVMTSALTMGSLVTFCSVLFGRRSSAVAATYAAGFAMTIVATFLAAFLPTSDARLWPPEVSEIAGYLNPFAALQAVVGYQARFFGVPVPAPLGDFLTPGSLAGPRLPVWQVHLGVAVGLVLGLNVASALLVRGRRRSTFD